MGLFYLFTAAVAALYIGLQDSNNVHYVSPHCSFFTAVLVEAGSY